MDVINLSLDVVCIIKHSSPRYLFLALLATLLATNQGPASGATDAPPNVLLHDIHHLLSPKGWKVIGIYEIFEWPFRGKFTKILLFD